MGVLLGYREGHGKGCFKVGYTITLQDLKVHVLDLEVTTRKMFLLGSSACLWYVGETILEVKD